MSLGTDKKMDVFSGWENYVERIERHWRDTVRPGDTVVLAGDLSWGKTLEEALADFRFLEALPGNKLALKGNHDYWWSTKAAMERFFSEHGLTSVQFLHNCAYEAQGRVLCGSRGWMFEKGEPHDKKIILREAARLEISLRAGENLEGERVAFLHYPPVYENAVMAQIVEVLVRYGVRRCYYGHLHAAACATAFNGVFQGIDFRLVSADHLRFRPLAVP